MVKAARKFAHSLGGLKRIVLGHSHTDHRGTAPHLGVPVYCHPDEVKDARREHWKLDYWDLSKVDWAPGRWIYPTLHRRWDGGPVEVAGTLDEGDEVAGFEVVHFPGHAYGLIGLWRERDGLALVSDTVYFIDSIHLRRREEIDEPNLKGFEPSVAHPAWNHDTERARQSVRKLAALRPRAVWAGHAEALEGDPGAVSERLEAGSEEHFAEDRASGASPGAPARNP
jgi:hydroxyacylglutathione hydrolase